MLQYTDTANYWLPVLHVIHLPKKRQNTQSYDFQIFYIAIISYLLLNSFGHNNLIVKIRFCDSPTLDISTLWFLWVCMCVYVLPTLQESSRCCAIVETFSTTVRSRDCVACEMNVTASIGTSVTPNFLAAKEKHTHTQLEQGKTL